MIDAFFLEALAATGCVGLGLAAQRRRSGSDRSAVAPTIRSIAQLPYRQRREARAIVAIVRDHLTRHPNGSIEAFTAREALRSYIPDTIAAYLAVPPALRRLRRAGGLSPDDELSRQLRTVRNGLERLREADAEAGAARMALNGAFLNERFGSPGAEPLGRFALTIVQELIDTLRAVLRPR